MREGALDEAVAGRFNREEDWVGFRASLPKMSMRVKVEDVRGGGEAGMFFFSSRRRHTRLTCDWSSDVCSSDLVASARICFCMEEHSSTSPALMSVKIETPTAHSNPEPTSLASSLKRRSELTRPDRKSVG